MRRRSLGLAIIAILVFSTMGMLYSSVCLAEFDPERTYICGVEAAFPPWAYVEKGEYKGITVDTMREIAKIEGLKLEFRDLPWPSLIPALSAGKIDILVSSLRVTHERDKVIDYTIPFFEERDQVLVLEDSDLNIATALCCGAKIGVQGGSTQHLWAEENLLEKGVDVTISTYEGYVMVVEDLETGRTDSIIVGILAAAEFLDKGRSVKIVGTIENPTSDAMAVTQGDPYDLLPRLNHGLMVVYELGKWTEILHKYLPSGIAVPAIPARLTEGIETYQHPIAGVDEEVE